MAKNQQDQHDQPGLQDTPGYDWQSMIRELRSIRDGGRVNMMDRDGVLNVAVESGHQNVISWIMGLSQNHMTAGKLYMAGLNAMGDVAGTPTQPLTEDHSTEEFLPDSESAPDSVLASESAPDPAPSKKSRKSASDKISVDDL